MEQSEPPTRELTLEDAVSIAILLQKNEQLVEAQELARAAVSSLSESGDTIHLRFQTFCQSRGRCTPPSGLARWELILTSSCR
jgi:hypothetical protein